MEKYNVFRKSLVIGIIILFVGASITPSISGVISSTKITENSLRDDEESTDTTTKTIQVISGNQPPVAIFTFKPQGAPPGNTVRFDASSSYDPDGTITYYEWDFENNGIYEGHPTPKAGHIWSKAGTYPVTLRVTDNNGATATKTRNVEVSGGNKPPVAKFTFSPQGVPLGNTVRFDASSSYDPDGTITYYEWDFENNGVYEGHPTPKAGHIWSKAGTYPVTLRVTDYDGATAKMTKNVKVIEGNKPPEIPDTPSGPTTLEVEQSGTFSTKTTDPDSLWVQYRFDWDAEGSHDYSDWTRLFLRGRRIYKSHSWNSLGIYVVKVQARDSQGAMSQWSNGLRVVVGDVDKSPIAYFSWTPEEPDPGEIIAFDASSSSDPDGTIVSYEWDFDDDGQYDDATGEITTWQWPNADYYSVSLKVKDNDALTDTVKRIINIGMGTGQDKLLPSDGAEDDSFGKSVSIDGDYAIIGAPEDNDNGLNSGSAYIFKRDGNSWTEQTKLLASDGASFDRFGTSVSINGEYAIIGAPYDDDNGPGSGSAYIFIRSGSVWTEQTKLLASDGADSDQFGSSVSIDGDYVIIGASWDDDNGDFSGSAYVFKRDGTNWNEQDKLLASDGAEDDSFGYSVSIDGNYILIGAVYDKDNGLNSGSAYIFSRSDTTWTQQAKLLPSDGAAYDEFGYSVSIDGDYVIIGASRKNVYTGSAYVFKRDGTDWTQQAKLLASDGAEGDWFGASVSISGDYAIIGAPYDDDNGDDSGSAYVFKEDEGENQPIAIAGGPYYGEIGKEITFDGSNSYDPNGDDLYYRWDFNNDGVWDTPDSKEPIATHIYDEEYHGFVNLEVHDLDQNYDNDTADVDIFDMEKGLAAYWSFNDGTATDNSNHGHDGTLHGDLKVLPGVDGKCLFFDGETDFISINEFDVDTMPELTICFWMKPHTIKFPKNMCIFDEADLRIQLKPIYNEDVIEDMKLEYYEYYDGGNTEPADCIFPGHSVCNGGDNHGLVCFDDSCPGGTIKSNVLPRWTFVVCKYNTYDPPSEDMKLYIDGELKDSASHSDGMWPDDDFYIAHWSSINPFEDIKRYKGHLDEIRVYDRALSDEEIQFLYNYPIGGNLPPVAVIDEINPYALHVDELANFTGRGYDEDGNIVRYEWDFTGNGIYTWSSTSSGVAQDVSYSIPGMYYASFRVIDNNGAVSPVEYQRVFVTDGEVWRPGTYDSSVALNFSQGSGLATLISSANHESGAVSVYSGVISAPYKYGDSNAVMLTPYFEIDKTHTYNILAELLSIGGKDFFPSPIGFAIGETGCQISHFKYNEEKEEWELIHGYTRAGIDSWLDIELAGNIIFTLSWLLPPLYGLPFTLISLIQQWLRLNSPNDLARAMKSGNSDAHLSSWTITLEPGKHYLAFGPYSYVMCFGVSSGYTTRAGQVRYISAQKTNHPPSDELILTTLCPVNLEVTDPEGRYINLTNSTISNSSYIKADLDLDGEADNQIQISNPMESEYKVAVVPEVNASENDTYSIIVNIDGGSYYLVEDAKIEDIPVEGYMLNVTKPNKPDTPSGPASGKPGIEYTYTTSATHPDGDQLFYMWDWADGNFTEWLGPYNSGETVTAKYIWAEKGTFEIKVKAKSEHGPESEWSDPLVVTMPRMKSFNFNFNLLNWFFDRFPNAFPILRQLLGL